MKYSGDSAKETFVSSDFSAERNQYVYVRACDSLGNCSGKSQTMIKIDKTRPTCSTSKSSIGSASGVNVAISCKDDSHATTNSGVKTCAGTNGASSSKTGVKTTTSYTVTDKAGNSNTCSASVTYDSCYHVGYTCAYGCDTCGGDAYSCPETKCVTTSSMNTYCPNGGVFVAGRGCCYEIPKTCYHDTYRCNCSSCHHYVNTCSGGYK